MNMAGSYISPLTDHSRPTYIDLKEKAVAMPRRHNPHRVHEAPSLRVYFAIPVFSQPYGLRLRTSVVRLARKTEAITTIAYVVEVAE